MPRSPSRNGGPSTFDPSRERDRARRAWESHLARAKWMTTHGYRHLLEGGTHH